MFTALSTGISGSKARSRIRGQFEDLGRRAIVPARRARARRLISRKNAPLALREHPTTTAAAASAFASSAPNSIYYFSGIE
ncbi:hypothetical protein [Caballeronia humi]|uniref:hypothetical protein n=1 Tax=Caballeronia humi TaxID=326474 RepID=UPI000F74BB82|nr:hypothetical protein [Caballeronia humi]